MNQESLAGISLAKLGLRFNLVNVIPVLGPPAFAPGPCLERGPNEKAQCR